MATEQQVRLAAQMYKVRDTARSLWGADYAAKVAEAAALIRRAPIEPIRFLPWISAKLLADGKSMSDGDVLLFTAATVEITEGSV